MSDVILIVTSHRCVAVVGKMRNCGMRKVKCGFECPERRRLVEAASHVAAVFLHYSIHIAIGRVVKCRPEMRKIANTEQQDTCSNEHRVCPMPPYKVL